MPDPVCGDGSPAPGGNTANCPVYCPDGSPAPGNNAANCPVGGGCTDPAPTCQNQGISCGSTNVWWCPQDPTNSQYVHLDCGACSCTLPERLYNGQCLGPVDWCQANGQVFDTTLQTCVDPGGSCPDSGYWLDCSGNGVANDGTPPNDQYSVAVTYHWQYPYCGIPTGNWSFDVNYGNCPRPDTHSTIAVNNNTSGGWSINGISGSGSDTISVNPSNTGTLYTITPGAVTGYDYPPTITNSVTGVGSSFLLFQQSSASYTLTYGNAFDYSLSNSGTATVMKGGVPQPGQETITKTLTAGSTRAITLAVSGVPTGVGYTISSQTCNITCSSTITFSVDPTTAAGTYPITVTGTPGNKTTVFNLVIQNSPDIIVNCSAAPSPALVGQQVTWSGAVSGGRPPYTFVWSGTSMPTPAPTTQSMSITYSTVGAKTAQLHVTDSLSNVGTCSPAGTVQINFNPQFKEF